MTEAREALREKIAEALHETPGLLAGDTLIFEEVTAVSRLVGPWEPAEQLEPDHG